MEDKIFITLENEFITRFVSSKSSSHHSCAIEVNKGEIFSQKSVNKTEFKWGFLIKIKFNIQGEFAYLTS